MADVDDADGYAGPDGHGRVPWHPWVELGNCRNCRQSHPMRSIGCALIPTDTYSYIFIHSLNLFLCVFSYDNVIDTLL